MIFLPKGKLAVRGMALAVGVAILSACAPPPDDLTNSRLVQAPAGTPIPSPSDAGDIAIAGQYAAHAIMDLPEVANATTPPLVQFTGVTSIIVGQVPVDTEPYTELLRDRMVLIAREKLRFIERELPPLIIKTKGKKKKAAPPSDAPENPDYQLLAELHGRYKDDFYKVQIQFVDIHTGAVLFNGLYRIAKEVPPADDTTPAPSDTAVPPPPPAGNGVPSPADNGIPATPTTQDPSQSSAPGMTQ